MKIFSILFKLQFIRFLLASGTSAVLNMLFRFLFNFIFSFFISLLLASIISMTYAFIVNKKYTFDNKDKNLKAQYVRYIIVTLLGMAILLGVSTGLYDYVFPAIEMDFFPAEIAQLIGLASMTVTYFLHKYISFKAKRGAGRK